MRSLTPLVCLFAFAAFSLGPSPVPPALGAQADWVLLDENADSQFFYDQNGTDQTREGYQRVKTRVIYSPQGKAEALKILTTARNLEELYESRYSHDLNCDEMEYRVLAVSHLDRRGTVLKSSDLATVTDWETIPPEARLALVADRVCHR